MAIMRTLLVSVDSKRSWASMSATWVGMPPSVVMRWRSTMSSASPADQRAIRNDVPPPRRAWGSLVM